MIKQKVHKILIIMVMPVEAKGLLNLIDFEEVPAGLDADLPATLYTSNYAGKQIMLVVSGSCALHQVERIGSQPATLLAWEGIKKFNPDLIINAGTCGGFQRQGAKVGDVYGSETHFVYNDRLMQPAVPFVNYGLGYYPADDFLSLYASVGIKPGIISTGNTLVLSEAQEAARLETGAHVKDMEAAAIADVAMLKQIPFMGIKVVTDIVDDKESLFEQFQANLKKVLPNLTQAVVEIIETI